MKIKSFDEFKKDYDNTLHVDCIFIDKNSLNDKNIKSLISQYRQYSTLLEYKQYTQIRGTNYCARYDAANTNTNTQAHYHVYYKQNQLYALNQDGSFHDGTSRILNKKEKEFFRSKGFNLPNYESLAVKNIGDIDNYIILNLQEPITSNNLLLD